MGKLPPEGAAQPRVLVVISYVTEPSLYPRSGRPEHRHDIYWSSIAASVATLRHVDGSRAEVVVFAGDDPPQRPAQVLDAAGVEVRRLAFGHQPPEGFYHRYVGSLFVLDAMAAMASEVGPGDVVLFVDPDIVWVASLDALLEEVQRGGVVAYELPVPDDKLMCHLTRRDQGRILVEMTGRGPDPQGPAWPHFGGELYGMLGSELASLVHRLEDLWTATLDRHDRGLPHYNVEEHLMNAVLWERGEEEGRANRFIQRIVTLPAPRGSRHRAVPGLVAWHLPIEKDRGFQRVLRRITSGRPMPPPGPTFERWAARATGIRPTPARWLTDQARRAKWATLDRNDSPVHGI